MPLGEEFQPEAAIVNYFGPSDMLGAHVDDMEADWSKPIVSISLGCKAVFLLGGKSREDLPLAMFLRSGDLVLMAAEARECFHVPMFQSSHQDNAKSPMIVQGQVDLLSEEKRKEAFVQLCAFVDAALSSYQQQMSRKRSVAGTVYLTQEDLSKVTKRIEKVEKKVKSSQKAKGAPIDRSAKIPEASPSVKAKRQRTKAKTVKTSTSSKNSASRFPTKAKRMSAAAYRKALLSVEGGIKKKRGIPRIFTDKDNAEVSILSQFLDEEDTCFRDYIATSRINFNIRQVN